LYTYDHPRAANTVDLVIIKRTSSSMQLLLVKRANEPFKGRFALPGGFVDQNETLSVAATRELEEETGITGVDLIQIHTFSDPERDPRGRVISTAYGTILNEDFEVNPKAGSDAASLKWFDLTDLPPLAFDHQIITEEALKKLRINPFG
jgi:8-oxo-dGTP diphosphatase